MDAGGVGRSSVSTPWVEQGQDSWPIRPLETASPGFQGLVQGHTEAWWPQEVKAPSQSSSRGAGEAVLWGGSLEQHPVAGPDRTERSERPGFGLCLLSMGPSFPFAKGVKVIYNQGRQAGGWGSNLGQAQWQERLTCFPPPGLGGADGEELRTQPVDSPAAGRQTFVGTGQGP